jgi:hypothetical protein
MKIEEIKRQVDVSIREFEPIRWSNLDYRGDNVRILPFDEQSITLTISRWVGDQMISEDSRDESLKMVATMNEWGALRDVGGFSPDDPEINHAIDAAIKEAATQ